MAPTTRAHQRKSSATQTPSLTNNPIPLGFLGAEEREGGEEERQAEIVKNEETDASTSFICINCMAPVDSLYKRYSAGSDGIRMTKCVSKKIRKKN